MFGLRKSVSTDFDAPAPAHLKSSWALRRQSTSYSLGLHLPESPTAAQVAQRRSGRSEAGGEGAVSPRPEAFHDYMKLVTRCHEKLAAEREEFRRQVLDLTNEVALLRSEQFMRSNELDKDFFFDGAGRSPRRSSLKLPDGAEAELAFAPKATVATVVSEMPPVKRMISDTSWGDVSEGSRMNPLPFTASVVEFSHQDIQGMESQASNAKDPVLRWGILAQELLRRIGMETQDKGLATAFGRLVVQNKSSTLTSRAASPASSWEPSKPEKTWGQAFVLSPTCPQRLIWCLIGLVLLFWDALMIPMQVFTIGDLGEVYLRVLSDFWLVIRSVSIFTLIFWLIDMPFQCFVSFQLPDGTEEKRPAHIALNYLRTWFLMDLSVLVIDAGLAFLDLAYEDFSGPSTGDTSFLKAGRYLRVARIARLLRLARLLRMRKLHEFLTHAVFRIKSQHMILFMKLAKHVGLILLVNHYIACCWYGLAALNTGGHTWLDEYALEDNRLLDVYFMSLHWSMTQFSPATNNIAPQNRFERIFAVCVVLFALISFSSFISSVTNTVNELRTLNLEPQMEEVRIREFLFTRNVSPDLVGRILSFFRQNFRGTQKRVYEEDIGFFQDVPESMKIRLHQEIYMPIITASPIFNPISDLGKNQLIQVCHTAISELFYLPQQDVFVDGSPSAGVYFVNSGRLYYHYHLLRIASAASFGQEMEHIEVAEHAWISELCLWVDWEHCGQLCAESSCELLRIDKVQFNAVLAKTSGTFVECLKRFVAFLRGHLESTTLPVNDLSIGADLLQTFSSKARKLWELQHRSSPRSRSSSRKSSLRASQQPSNRTRRASLPRWLERPSMERGLPTPGRGPLV